MAIAQRATAPFLRTFCDHGHRLGLAHLRDACMDGSCVDIGIVAVDAGSVHRAVGSAHNIHVNLKAYCSAVPRQVQIQRRRLANLLRRVDWCGCRCGRRCRRCRVSARGVVFALEKLSEKRFCGAIGRIRVVDEMLDHFVLPLLAQTLN
jgi:hypothetical protein